MKQDAVEDYTSEEAANKTEEVEQKVVLEALCEETGKKTEEIEQEVVLEAGIAGREDLRRWY